MAVIKFPNPDFEVARKAFTEIELPMPPMGGKCWVLAKKGQFLLQRGPGMLVTVNCTHAGSGTLEIFDGIPDDEGLFSERKLVFKDKGEVKVPGIRASEDDKNFGLRNGRSLKRANPVVMGAWMSNAGFFHGLTVRHLGGQSGVPAVAAIVWMPYRGQL